MTGRRPRNARDVIFMNEKERLLMTVVLIAFVGGVTIGVLGAVAFTVYLGAKVAQETLNPLRAAADWSGTTVWAVVGSDEAECSQSADRLKEHKRTVHALGVPESPGAAIVPAPNVVMATAHFHQPVAESQSAGADDSVLAAEGRRGNTHALALAISKPVDTPVGATEPEISLTRPTSPNAATSVTMHGEGSRRQTGPKALRW